MTDVVLRELFSADQVQKRIDELVEELYRDYADTPACFVVIAEGARRFAAALVEGLEARFVMPSVVFLRATRTRGSNLGEVQVESVDPSEFEDRDVLIIDDIADEGRTLEAVWSLVQEGDPRSLRAAVLVSKAARRQVSLPIRYEGFPVKTGWIVGYGMDLDGRYRDLDHLAVIEGLD